MHNRAEALAGLASFVPKAGSAYTQGRNTDEGPERPSAVSQLSAAIRHRLITEQEVVAAVLAQHHLPAAEKFVQEVCWRTYWKGWLQQRPGVWASYCQGRDAAFAALATDATLAARYQQAIAGETGIACFNDWMQELHSTGTLHNHTRMWLASIWVFTLRLPWVLGADHFLQHLADGDAASNTLSWRWVAGLQTVGKHYLARADNIRTYTNGRHHPAGLLVETAAPLPAEPLPPLQPLATPAATVPAKALLLITDDDTSPETLWPRHAPAPVAIAAFHGGLEQRSPKGLSPIARAFAEGALQDALTRAAARWPSATVLPAVTDLASALQQSGTQAVCLAELPIGPTHDALAPQLHGLPVHSLRREWDTAFWPHAQRGFFALRERIPSVLGGLGMV